MTSPVSNPNSLTKDRLKTELRKANVSLPRLDSKKDVYVELYRTHLLSPRSEFSSDEDDRPSTPSRNKRLSNTPKSKMPSKKASSDNMEVFGLSDADLAEQLRSLGVDVGPILDSTRKVYQKKLQKLLAESVKAEAASPSMPVDELEFSDRDETELKVYAPTSSSYRQSRITEHTTYEKQDVRRRQVGSSTPSKSPGRTTRSSPSRTTRSSPSRATRSSPGRTTRASRYVEPEPEPEPEEEEEEEEVMEDMEFEEDEDMEGGTEETMEEDVVDSREYTSVNYRTAARDYANSVTTQAKPTEQQTTTKRSHSIWLQLGILLVVGVIIFLIIHNMEPANQSPIGKLAGEV